MPVKVKTVEKRIWDTEGFDVKFKHQNGKDVKGSKEGMPQYKFQRLAKNDMTVQKWKDNRFKPSYPGYDVDVLNGDGEAAPGQMKLGTVRDTYSEDDE